MFAGCSSQAEVRIDRLPDGEQTIEVDGQKMTATVLIDGRLELRCGVQDRVYTLRTHLDALRHEYAEREKDIKGLTADIVEKTKEISNVEGTDAIVEEFRTLSQLIGNHRARLEAMRAENITWRQGYKRKHVVMPVGKLCKVKWLKYKVVWCVEEVELEDVVVEDAVCTKSDIFDVSTYQDERVYAVGGRTTDNTTLSSMEIYNPNTKEWTLGASMKDARWIHGLAVLDGRIYATGGGDAQNNVLSSVECYDPFSSSWSYVAPMLTTRDNHKTAVLNNKIYVVGGCDDRVSLKSVECYDAPTNTWTEVAPMKRARQAPGIAVYG